MSKSLNHAIPASAEVELRSGTPKLEAGELPVVLLECRADSWTLLTSRRVLSCSSRGILSDCYLDQVVEGSVMLRPEARKEDVRFVNIASVDGSTMQLWAPDSAYAAAIAHSLLLLSRALPQAPYSRPGAQTSLAVAPPIREDARMKSLGALLFLYGIAAFAVHFLEYDLVAFDWIGNWSEGAAWGIRGGFVVLGLLMLSRGGKRS